VSEAAAQDEVEHGVLELALGRGGACGQDSGQLLAAARGARAVQDRDQ
jgi:hypothetical protein